MFNVLETVSTMKTTPNIIVLVTLMSFLNVFLCVTDTVTLVSNSRLDFGESLLSFETCTIQLITCQLNSSSKRMDSSYDIVPLRPPVVLSAVDYVENESGYIQCNNRQKYSLVHSDFLFTPNLLRMPTCVVQIYVDPASCHQWKMAINPTKVTMFSSKVNVLPMNYQQLVKSDWHSLLTLYTNQVKHYWFFIRTRKFTSPTESFIKWDEIHFSGYAFAAPAGTSFTRIVAEPMFLIFRIEYKSSKNIHVIKGTYISSLKLTIRRFITEILKCSGFYHELKNKQHCCAETSVIKFLKMPLKPFAIEAHSKMLDIWKLGLISTHEISVFATQNFEKSESAKRSVTVQMISLLFENGTIIFAKNKNSINSLSLIPTIHMTQLSFLGSTLGNEVEVPFPIHFLSCTALRHITGLSLVGFISAFDFTTWLLFILFSTVTSVIMGNINCKWSARTFDRYTFAFNILISQPIYVPCNCKLILMAWLLVGVQMSYQYRGENVSEFVARLEPKHFDSLSDLIAHKFRIYSLPLAEIAGIFEAMEVQLTPDDLVQLLNEFLKRSRKMTNVGMPLEADLYAVGYPGLIPKSEKDKFQSLVVRPRELKDYLGWTTQNVSENLVTCKKEAFIGNLQQVANMYDNLIGSGRVEIKENLHISSESNVTQYYVWMFNQLPISSEMFSVRFKSLIHSGILTMLSRKRKRDFLMQANSTFNQYKGKREGVLRRAYALTMNSNVIGIFLLWAAMSLLAVACFLWEAYLNVDLLKVFAVAHLLISVIKQIAKNWIVHLLFGFAQIHQIPNRNPYKLPVS